MPNLLQEGSRIIVDQTSLAFAGDLIQELHDSLSYSEWIETTFGFVELTEA